MKETDQEETNEDICTCKSSHEDHICPYQEDVEENSEHYCTCCPHCTEECAACI